MRILICGAGGQLGHELTRLLEQGVGEIGPIPAAYRGAEVTKTDVAALDITDASAVERLVAAGAFDLVINCAAMTNVDGCEEQEDAAYRINAQGAENLARAAARQGAKIVHVSTDYVFSGDEAAERVEGDPTGPQSAYGRTKLAGELLVAAANPRHFIVRTAWLYGYVGKNFVKTIMALARDRGAIRVVDDQRGNPTSANDLAYEILRIAETEDFGTYHATNKGTCSWFEFACAIVDGAGIPCEKTPCATADFPRPAKRPTFSSLRNKRLEDTIGDEMRTWQDALADYLENLPGHRGDPPDKE
ncbi:MAG: dTDP-4-dehydrorhamnose reductase [Eggerthellaceae bacterium]|jgi:dTDP-4-dehydrorhamnose reductase|nr:dTDP-4-dehydrorhamnose reductase [Eggerthellaceae bacterium]MDR2715747.1 dTDP-4-dehydrorhamnose reductase [Coriobacteriaceae bacterium]